MRLIRTKDFSLIDFSSTTVRPYAILSHRWLEDEVTYQDFENGSFHKRRGFRKIEQACRVAENCGYDYLWCDTCCIDKRNNSDLSEAINSMYKWYQRAGICIAYIFDHTYGYDALCESSWFRRCWTLQELIAPRSVRFFDSSWTYIGSKRSRCREIAGITGIPDWVLEGGDPKQCSIAQRMCRASRREATRIEDEAYSLLGIFGVSMPTVYGSGLQAFRDLQEKLLHKHDQSIFAWKKSSKKVESTYTGLLAERPADFASCQDTVHFESAVGSMISIGDGIQLNSNLKPDAAGVYLCPLACTSGSPGRQDAILLQQLDAPQEYARIFSRQVFSLPISRAKQERDTSRQTRRLYIFHELRHQPLKILPSIYVPSINLRRHKSANHETKLLSRLDGPVALRNVGAMLQIPAGTSGTAGYIHLPVIKEHLRYRLISWIKVGFDLRSRPALRMGFNKSTAEEVRLATENRPRHGILDYAKIWSDDWIYEFP